MIYVYLNTKKREFCGSLFVQVFDKLYVHIELVFINLIEIFKGRLSRKSQCKIKDTFPTSRLFY